MCGDDNVDDDDDIDDDKVMMTMTIDDAGLCWLFFVFCWSTYDYSCGLQVSGRSFRLDLEVV